MVKDAQVVGLMAIADFPMAPEMVADLAKRCDRVILRFDALNGDKKLFKKCIRTAANITHVDTIRSRVKWNRWNWREDMIRACDAIKPDLILAPDSDEKFGEGFDEELKEFYKSTYDIMLFDYQMVTDDGREVRRYPGARHCKAFKWIPNIGYRPYLGYAQPTWPAKDCWVWFAKTPMLHYCFYTRQMEQTKVLHK